MSSAVKKMKRNKNKAREFQITASVSALTLECWNDVWDPYKIVIVWNKNDRDSSCVTKPVPWQPGLNNPFRGIHVWPEPDPVEFTSTLFKNPRSEGTYKDHPWNFAIKNESRSGRLKVIATGSIDLADYISETKKTFDITVSLKAANKNIKSGSMEFSLTSVLLVDGIPYRTREELISEILQEAMNSASAANKKEKLYAGEGADNIPMINVSATVTVMPSSTADKTVESKTGTTKDWSEAKESSVPAREKIKPGVDSSNGEEKKIRRKVPRRPKIPPAGPQQTAEMEMLTMKEVKSLSAQGNVKEKKSNSGEKKKTNSKTKRSKESNSVDHSIEERRSLTSELALPCKQTSLKDFQEGTESNGRNGKQKRPSRADRRSKLKKAIKHPKRRNRNNERREEETELSSFGDCNKESIVHSVTEQKICEQKSSSESSMSAQTVVRKKTRSVKSGTEYEDDATRDDEHPLSSEAEVVLSQCTETSEHAANIEAADHRGTVGSGCKVNKQGDVAATDSVKKVETDAATKESEKQKLTSFFNKLLKPVAQKVSQQCPKLSAFVAEEMRLLKEEISSLDKVTLKLELEMRQTMNVPECREELDGLMQDWITLNDYREELVSRKNSLQILDKQEDVEHCCNIMRSELKLLFRVQDWRKTAHHRAQEARLLDLLLSFVNKRRENC